MLIASAKQTQVAMPENANAGRRHVPTRNHLKSYLDVFSIARQLFITQINFLRHGFRELELLSV